MRRKKLIRLINKLNDYVNSGDAPETILEDAKNGRISILEDGFAVYKGESCFADVKWDDVEEIRAYKIDVFSYDLICFCFGCCDNDSFIEVHEAMEGFRSLQKAVEERYKNLLDDWWSKVSFPAFAANMTTIWEKQNST